MVMPEEPVFELPALINLVEEVREGVRLAGTAAERILDAAGAAVCD